MPAINLVQYIAVSGSDASGAVAVDMSAVGVTNECGEHNPFIAPSAASGTAAATAGAVVSVSSSANSGSASVGAANATAGSSFSSVALSVDSARTSPQPTSAEVLAGISLPDAILPFSYVASAVLEMFRDLPWTFTTVRKDNIFKNPDEAGTWQQEWLTQFVLSIPTLMVGIASICAVSPKFRTKQGVAVLAMYALAQLLSLPCWNYGDDQGTTMARNQGYDETTANILGGVSAGLIEAVVQFTIISLVSALLMKKWGDNDNAPQSKCKSAGKKLVEFICSNPGGMVWKWSYMAVALVPEFLMKDIFRPLVMGVGVAASVCGTGLFFGKTSDAASKCIDKRRRSSGYAQVDSDSAQLAAGPLPARSARR